MKHLFATLFLALLLAGCGGGGDSQIEPDANLPGPPDCANRPELCI